MFWCLSLHSKDFKKYVLKLRYNWHDAQIKIYVVLAVLDSLCKLGWL